LLKDGGLAGIILLSSILSNAGIYAKARKIILKYFKIVAITELGSNTFMATGTNTVVLFLQRCNNYAIKNLKTDVYKFFDNFKDVTLNNIEFPVSKYVKHVWDGLTLDDYITLVKKEPNLMVQNHELYQEYHSKLWIDYSLKVKKPLKANQEIQEMYQQKIIEAKAKSDKEFWLKVLKLEKEKLVTFVLAFPQKVVLVKTGQKDAEKHFLGYEFSFRRGHEGIHPIQRAKTIAECTSLFDEDSFTNPNKASTYIYHAFNSDFETKIPEALQENISRMNLLDMLTFDRAEFTRTISTNIKKKVVFEDIWNSNNLVRLGDIANIEKGKSITKQQIKEGNIPVIAGGKTPAYFHNIANRDGNVITVSASGAAGFVNYFTTPIFASDCNTIISKDEQIISTKLIYEFLKTIQNKIYELQRGQAQPHVYAKDLVEIKLPLPPLSVQEEIVAEIETLESQEQNAKNEIEKLKAEIGEIMRENVESKNWELVKMGDVAEIIRGVTYSKNDQSSTETNKVILTADNITLEGNFQIKKKVFLYEDYKITPEKRLIKNDIFMCFSSGSKEHLGKVAFISKNENYYAGGFMGIIRTKNNVLAKYVFQLLNGTFRQTIRNTGSGSNINNLSSVINDITLPLPPLEIQQKIVSEIEKLETRILQLESELREIPKMKEELLKSYL